MSACFDKHVRAALRTALADIIQRAQRLDDTTDSDQIEVELRIETTFVDFYARFASAICTGVVRQETVEFAESTTVTSTSGNAKYRSTYCGGCQILESSVRKTRVFSPCNFSSNLGRLRIDAHREQNIDQVVSSGHTRRRERISFRVKRAPHWRVEFTRVDSTDANNGDPKRHFEIEIELIPKRLRTSTPGYLADEAMLALDALGIIVT